MPYRAQNQSVAVGGARMDYAVFGRGSRPLVVLPGLSDGLRTVRGQALALAFYYRALTQDFRIHVFSRKDPLEAGCTTRSMARDLKAALVSLGIAKTCLLGVSQGGMIAQHLAIDYPESVERLALAVTAPRSNETLAGAIHTWVALAQKGDYKALLIDTMEKTYSPQTLKTYRLATPFLGLLRPKDPRRFLLQANACLTHDACAGLAAIRCPTLITAGGRDRIVGTEAAGQLAQAIPGSRLLVYETLGHAAYEEAKDFNRQLLAFLL